MNDFQSMLDEAVRQIAENHRKIIDDWCKAYMAQLYEINKDIKPGDFTLIQQPYGLHDDKAGFRYWFEPKFDADNRIRTNSGVMYWILVKFLKDSLDFLADNPRAKGMKRKEWIEEWMYENLNPETLKDWVPDVID